MFKPFAPNIGELVLLALWQAAHRPNPDERARVLLLESLLHYIHACSWDMARMARQEQKDFVQEVMIQLLNHLEGYRQQRASISTFAYDLAEKTACALGRKQVRRQKYQVETSEDVQQRLENQPAEPAEEAFADGPLAQQKLALAKQGIAKLKASQALLITLRCEHGLSWAEICRKLGIEPTEDNCNKLASRLCRAVKNLRKKILGEMKLQQIKTNTYV